MFEKVSKLKQVYCNYKILLENFSYMSALQIFAMISPLITYPYLIRVLGADKYGLVIFAQTIATYFTLIINFGFNISGVKDVALNINDKKKLSENVSSIIIVKFILGIISFIFYLTGILLISRFNQYFLLYLFSFALCFNDLFLPRWFFQGIEKMKYITYVNLVSRIIFILLIFVIIRNKEDYYKVPLLNGLGGLFGGFISMYLIFSKEGVPFKFQPVSKLVKYFKESIPYFGAKISSTLRDSANIVVIGLFFSNQIIAFYDLAMKVVSLFTALFQNVPVVILPRMVKSKDSLFAKKILNLSVLASLAFYIIIFVFSKEIVLGLGGKEMIDSVLFLKILGLFSTFYVLNTLTNYFLIANDFQTIVYKSIFYSFILYLIFIPILYFFKSVYFLIILFYLSSIFDLLYKLYFFKKYKLLNWLYGSKK